MSGQLIFNSILTLELRSGQEAVSSVLVDYLVVSSSCLALLILIVVVLISCTNPKRVGGE